jgi:hypothetical protein
MCGKFGSKEVMATLGDLVRADTWLVEQPSMHSPDTDLEDRTASCMKAVKSRRHLDADVQTLDQLCTSRDMYEFEQTMTQHLARATTLVSALQHSMKNYKTTRFSITKAHEQMKKDVEKATKRAVSASGNAGRTSTLRIGTYTPSLPIAG